MGKIRWRKKKKTIRCRSFIYAKLDIVAKKAAKHLLQDIFRKNNHVLSHPLNIRSSIWPVINIRNELNLLFSLEVLLIHLFERLHLIMMLATPQGVYDDEHAHIISLTKFMLLTWSKYKEFFKKIDSQLFSHKTHENRWHISKIDFTWWQNVCYLIVGTIFRYMKSFWVRFMNVIRSAILLFSFSCFPANNHTLLRYQC